MAKSSIAALEAEIKKQAEQLVEAKEKIAALEKESAGLRAVNENLVRPAAAAGKGKAKAGDAATAA